MTTQTTNTRYWDQLSRTDPRHIKPIAGKRYKGTNINAVHRMELMTEAFGPVGQGWGWVIEEHWREEFPVVVKDAKTQAERVDQKQFVFVRLYVWWKDATDAQGQSEKNVVGSQIGGTAIEADADDAYKKAITDALGKCMTALGVCADVYLGEHDGLPGGQSQGSGDRGQGDRGQAPAGKPAATRKAAPAKAAPPPATQHPTPSTQPASGPPAGVWDAYMTDITRKLAACKVPECASKVRRSIEDDLNGGKISQPTHAAAVALCKPRYDELTAERERMARDEANRRAVDDGPRLVKEEAVDADPDEHPAARPLCSGIDRQFVARFTEVVNTCERVGAVTAERKRLRSQKISSATLAACERICEAAIEAINRDEWAKDGERRAVAVA